MFKKVFLTLLAALSAVGGWADLKQDSKGNYLIGTPEDLCEFSAIVRSGQSSINALLTADIDMSSVENFMPIGLYADSGGPQQSYNGTFDGNGHVIRNLTVTREDESEVGLIGRGVSCTVQNLGVINAKMTSKAQIETESGVTGVRAGVIGGELASCVVRNCFSAGNIEINTLKDQKGGIAGEAAESTTFTNCFTTYETLSAVIGGGAFNSFAGDELSSFKPGELCYTLNGNQTVIHFYQNLTEDAYPTLDPSRGRVYASGELNCDGTPKGDVTYSNTDDGTKMPPHEFDENGYCINCGAEEGVVLPTEDEWYEITSAKELRYISRFVNKGNNRINIRLANDIDLAGMMMEPIGKYSDDANYPSVCFKGVFDGQNHIIYNLTVVCDDSQETGLFGRINEGGVLCNLGIVNAEITNGKGIRAGVFAGEIHACTVTNCFSAGDININTQHQQKAGISAEAASSNLINCYTTYDVLTNAASSTKNCYAGEFVAENISTGALCYALNGNSFQNPVYFQDIDSDEYPVLDNTHGIVYKTGEEEYASAKNDEEFKDILASMLAAEKELYEQKIATRSLLDNYLSSLDKLENASREEYAKAYVNLNGIRSAIKESEAAYSDYQKKIDEITAYLDENKSEGKEFDTLRDYLTKNVEPGEQFPNGSYKYILAELSLSASNIALEAEYAQGLLENAVKSNYQAGTDITNMIANADFSKQLTGWTIDKNKPSIYTQEGCKNLVYMLNQQLDINQTIYGLRPGLYEVHFNGYAEIKNSAEESAYNFNAFVYANGNSNYFHTKYTNLLTEDVAENLGEGFGPVTDSNGEYLGHGATGYNGLALAFSNGFYDNSIIVSVDDSLKLGVLSPGTYQRNTDTFLGNARLIFLGDYDQASKALDSQLADMVEKAKHMTQDYSIDLLTYGNAPSYSIAINDELTAAISAAEAATTGEAKYEAICKFSELFNSVYESKETYLQMITLNDEVYTAVTNSSAEEADEYEKNFYIPIEEAYQKGSYTTEEALACIENMKQNNAYRMVYGEEPEQDEDEFYLCDNPYHLIWVSNQVNSDKKRSMKFALTKDIDMSKLKNFTPIGLHSDIENPQSHPFNGVFDGRGHIISNLTIVCENGAEAGFFSRAIYATIKNVGIVNANVTNTRPYRSGILGGEIHLSTLSNVFTIGDLQVNTEHEQAGGLCGEAAGTVVTSCYTTHDVLTNSGSLKNCFYGSEIKSKMPTGELCYLLNGDQEEISFYQKIGEDAYPTTNSERGQVYCAGRLKCDGSSDGSVTYSNTPGEVVTTPHDYDENGYCKNCGADEGEGQVDEKGVFHLKNAYGLRWFSNFVNNGNTGAQAVLDTDVDMTGIEMHPIGCFSDDHDIAGDGVNKIFRGTFDGQGHEIRNLNIVVDDRFEGGLFGRAAGSATQIKNFGLVNPSVVNPSSNGCRLGAVCGELNEAVISNVYVVGNITLQTSNAQLASFAGEAHQGTIVNCYTTSELPISYQGTKTNCYQGEEVTKTVSTGELCFKLNGNSSVKPVWRQTLGKDAYPVLNKESMVVYQLEDGTFTNEMGEMDKYAGTAEDPIRIKSLHDMQVLHDYLKTGQMTYVTLETDLDMSGVTDWKPLNTNDDTFNGKGYMNWVNFDGKGHTITGFNCTKSGQAYNSLFGVLCGAVYNLGLVDCNVVCDASGTGVLAGYVGHGNYQDTTYVYNTYVTGRINVPSGYCGGMFGNVGGETVIRNCYANLDITSDAKYLGGLIGRINAALLMENCYAAGNCQGHGISGGRNSLAPASVFNNIVVWNNNYEDFGPTTSPDVLTGIKYFNGENFEELQQAVVAWDPQTWSAEGNEYPVLKATVSDPTGIQQTAGKATVNSSAVYSLSGVRVGTSLRNLPKGIYIMNGKKVMVK